MGVGKGLANVEINELNSGAEELAQCSAPSQQAKSPRFSHQNGVGLGQTGDKRTRRVKQVNRGR